MTNPPPLVHETGLGYAGRGQQAATGEQQSRAHHSDGGGLRPAGHQRRNLVLAERTGNLLGMGYYCSRHLLQKDIKQSH